MMDHYHSEWLDGLRNSSLRDGVQPAVIDMNGYVVGKTASVLSERELDVLRMISFGCTTNEVADRLCISNHTVNNHRKNMLARSRCQNFAELVRVATMEDLL